MKVTIVIPIDLNSPNGVEKHILRITESMRALGIGADACGPLPPTKHEDGHSKKQKQ